MASDTCPVYAPFFGALGCAASIVFANFGAAYGTAKSGVGVMSAGILRPENMIKSCTPVVMAGVLAIFGLVCAIQITTSLTGQPMPLSISMIHFGAGLSTGLSCLAAGFSIGIVGDAGTRAMAQQPRSFIGMMLILVFAEVLGLYGLIVGLLLIGNTKGSNVQC